MDILTTQEEIVWIVWHRSIARKQAAYLSLTAPEIACMFIVQYSFGSTDLVEGLAQ